MVPRSQSVHEPESRLVSATAFTFGLLYSLVSLPPWIPAFLTSEEFRDPSWRYVLHESFVDRLRFGTDVIFTYGPYGFLTTRMYHPQTYSLMLAIWVTLATVFFCLVWRMARRFTTSPWLALLVSLVSVRVVALEAMVFLFSFLVVLVAERQARRSPQSEDKSQQSWTDIALATSLVLIVGLLPLTKYSFVPATYFVVAVIAGIDVWNRRLPLQSMAVVGATVLFWGLSGQQFSDISHYFTAGFEVASRYVDAMTNWETEPFDIAFVLIGALLIPVLPFCLWRRSPGQSFIRSGIIPGIFCVLLFLVFKFTFVGFHGHKFPVYFGSAFLIALFSMLATGTRDEILHKRSVTGMALSAVLLMIGTVSTYARFFESSHSALALTVLSNPDHPAAMKAVLRGGDMMQKRHEANLEDVRRKHPLPQLNGRIDVVPDKLAIAIADDTSEFRPRPIMHTYATHAPWLAEQNAAFYRSAAGPQFVLFRINPIFERFPTLNDGRLWLELLRSFQVQEDLPTDLLLCRTTTQRHINLQRAAGVTTTWNQHVQVPRVTEGPIWCRILMKQTSAGRLATFAYKLPPLWLDVTHANTTKSYRLTASSAESGFLISPVLSDRQQFADLLANPRSATTIWNFKNTAVNSIRIHTSDASQRYFFEKDIEITFDEVVVSEPVPAISMQFQTVTH